MNTHIHTDAWMYGTMIVLGLIVLLSVLGAIILAIVNQPTPEILIVLGIVAAVILVRLLIPALIIG